MRLKVHLILHLLLCGRGFFHVFSIWQGLRTSSNSWCSFRSPKDAGLSSPDFGGWRVFSANCGITWLKLGSGYHLQHLGTRACIPFLYHITFSCALRSITSYPANSETNAGFHNIGGVPCQSRLPVNSISGKCYEMSMWFCGSSFHNCLPWRWIWKDWFPGRCISFLALHHPLLHSVVIDDLAGLLDIQLLNTWGPGVRDQS